MTNRYKNMNKQSQTFIPKENKMINTDLRGVIEVSDKETNTDLKMGEKIVKVEIINNNTAMN